MTFEGPWVRLSDGFHLHLPPTAESQTTDDHQTLASGGEETVTSSGGEPGVPRAAEQQEAGSVSDETPTLPDFEACLVLLDVCLLNE